jgi:hypothetical protein
MEYHGIEYQVVQTIPKGRLSWRPLLCVPSVSDSLEVEVLYPA